MTAPIFVSAAGLHAAISAILSAAGSDAREATLVADHIIEANLTGHDAHGIGVLPSYVASARAGEHRVNGRGEIVSDAGALLTVDGGTAYGQVIVYEAMQLGIERALSFGVAVVSTRNASHVGRVGHWAEQCAAAGYVSLHFVSGLADRAPVASDGAASGFAANPFCAGFPIPGEEPIILDFATSKIAFGKARVDTDTGEPVPDHTPIDAAGKPTTVPRALFLPPTGALLALGGHGGYGLAVICELFAGALSGGGTWSAERLGRRVDINNMLSIIVDPSRLGGRDAMAEEARRFSAWLKSARAGPDAEEVLLPGEPERRRRRERLAAGIPIDRAAWDDVLAAAESAGVPRAEIIRLAGLG